MWLDWRLLTTYFTMPLFVVYLVFQPDWVMQAMFHWFCEKVHRSQQEYFHSPLHAKMSCCLQINSHWLCKQGHKILKIALTLQETHGSFYIWLVLIGYDRLSPQLWHSSCEGCLSFHWQRWGWGMGSYLVLEGNILLFCFLIQGQICCIWVAGSSKKNL